MNSVELSDVEFVSLLNLSVCGPVGVPVCDNELSVWCWVVWVQCWVSWSVPQVCCMSTCQRCSVTSSTGRETPCPSVWPCSSMTKSCIHPPRPKDPLIPLLWSSIIITLNGCHNHLRKHWWDSELQAFHCFYLHFRPWKLLKQKMECVSVSLL